MLHRFYAHNSSGSPQSGSQSRLFIALLLTVTVFFGLSYSGVANAATSNQHVNLYAGHATHAKANAKAPAHAPGQNIVSKLSAQKKSAQQSKLHTNGGGLYAYFEDFSYSPVGSTPNAAGVAVDPYGDIFYSDFNAGCIYEAIPSSTGYNWAANPVICGHAGVLGLSVDAYDDLFVAAANEGTVFVVFPDGNGGWTQANVDTGLNYPVSVAVDPYYDVYVADESNGEVYLETYQGNLVWSESTVYSGDFNAPTAVALDGNGDLFVGDYYPFGGPAYSDLYVLTNSGGGLNPPFYINVDGSFDSISGIVVASNGNLYVTDDGYDSGYPGVIQLFVNPYWGYEIGTVLLQDYNGNLVQPYGGSIDALGNFYTADYGNGDVVEDSTNVGAVQVGYTNYPENYIYANFDITGSGTYYGAFALTDGEWLYDYYNQNDPCAGSVFSGGDNFCTVQVGFAPLTAGARTGAVTLEDTNGANIGDSLSFQGTGVAPLASFLPGTYSYTGFTPYAVKAGKPNKFLKQTQKAKAPASYKMSANGIAGYAGSTANGIVVDPYGSIYVADPSSCSLWYSSDSGNNWNYLPTYSIAAGASLCPSGGLAIDGAGNVFFTTNWDSFPGAVWVDYANNPEVVSDSELVALDNSYFGTYGSNAALFDYVDGVAVDQNDNVFFTAYPDGDPNQYEYVFEAPYQTYFGNFDAPLVAEYNYYMVNVIPTPFDYLPGISIFTNWTNDDVIAVTDYYNGQVDLFFPSTTGVYSEEQIVRGIDTPSAVQWTPYGDLYIIDSGDDTGISVLYVVTPGYGAGGPSAGFQLTPLSISNYGAGSGPYYWNFTTDSVQNFYITDNGVDANLCMGCLNVITEIDTNDPPTIQFNDSTVGVASSDSPEVVLISDSGNDNIQLVAPVTGTNPSISTNYLLNTTWLSYYPGTTIPTYDCPLLTPGGYNYYINAPFACALPVTFLPLTAGVDDGTLVVTDNSLYGTSYGSYFVKGAARPAKTRTANLQRSQVKLSGMGHPVSSYKPQNTGTINQTINLIGYAAQATPAVTLLSAENPAMVGDVVPFAIAVDGPGVTPTGVVDLYDNGGLVGTGILSGGVVTINITYGAGTAGTHPMSAYYEGDTNYLPAFSNTVQELVVDFSMDFTISGGSYGFQGGKNLPIVRNGQSLTVDFTISPVPSTTTFPFPITMSGSGGPQNTSYTFTPTTIPANSGPTTVVLVLNIPIDFIATNNAPMTPGNSKLPIAPLALAALLLPLAGRLRKAGKRFSKMLALALLAIAGITATVTLSGCGANTAAVYQIQVTGTSGSLVHNTTFDIVVE